MAYPVSYGAVASRPIRHLRVPEISAAAGGRGSHANESIAHWACSATCQHEACSRFASTYEYREFRLLDSGLIEFKVSTKNVTNPEPFLIVDSQEEPMIREDGDAWVASAPPPEEGKKLLVQFRILSDGWRGSRIEEISYKYLVWVNEKSEVAWDILDEK